MYDILKRKRYSFMALERISKDISSKRLCIRDGKHGGFNAVESWFTLSGKRYEVEFVKGAYRTATEIKRSFNPFTAFFKVLSWTVLFVSIPVYLVHKFSKDRVIAEINSSKTTEVVETTSTIRERILSDGDDVSTGSNETIPDEEQILLKKRTERAQKKLEMISRMVDLRSESNQVFEDMKTIFPDVASGKTCLEVELSDFAEGISESGMQIMVEYLRVKKLLESTDLPLHEVKELEKALGSLSKRLSTLVEKFDSESGKYTVYRLRLERILSKYKKYLFSSDRPVFRKDLVAYVKDFFPQIKKAILGANQSSDSSLDELLMKLGSQEKAIAGLASLLRDLNGCKTSVETLLKEKEHKCIQDMAALQEAVSLKREQRLLKLTNLPGISKQLAEEKASFPSHQLRLIDCINRLSEKKADVKALLENYKQAGRRSSVKRQEFAPRVKKLQELYLKYDRYLSTLKENHAWYSQDFSDIDTHLVSVQEKFPEGRNVFEERLLDKALTQSNSYLHELREMGAVVIRNLEASESVIGSTESELEKVKKMKKGKVKVAKIYEPEEGPVYKPGGSMVTHVPI